MLLVLYDGIQPCNNATPCNSRKKKEKKRNQVPLRSFSWLNTSQICRYEKIIIVVIFLIWNQNFNWQDLSNLFMESIIFFIKTKLLLQRKICLNFNQENYRENYLFQWYSLFVKRNFLRSQIKRLLIIYLSGKAHYTSWYRIMSYAQPNAVRKILLQR